MKVSEYVKQLQALDQDAEVVKADSGCGCCRSEGQFFRARDPQAHSGMIPSPSWAEEGDDDYTLVPAKLGSGEAEAPFVVI